MMQCAPTLSEVTRQMMCMVEEVDYHSEDDSDEKEKDQALP